VHVRHWHVLALIPQSSLVLHLQQGARSRGSGGSHKA